MRIGDIEAQAGEKAYGFFKVTQTHGRFDIQVPLHIVAGSRPGPTLLVQSGVSGLEIEPAMILPKIVDELDPEQMSGNLIMVPLLNTSGFEFEQRRSIWDDSDLNTLGRGRPDGTVSEQMIHAYYQAAVAQADAVIEIHTGELWGYFRYAGIYETGDTNKSTELAAAMGLPHVVVGQPTDRSLAHEAAQDGKAVVSAWIGGGPGLRDYREEDQARIRIGVLNALKHLGILAGAPAEPEGTVIVLRAHTVLRPEGERGLTFIDKNKRGRQVAADEAIGYIEHPFTGDILHEICAPRAGVMIHGGASWPIVPEDAILAILGDVME